MHYLCFFCENNCKKNRKTYFVSQGLNETKCKITSKTTRKLKSKSISIEFCLPISLEWLALVCFCNEQLEPADCNYALKETRFNNVTIQKEFPTLWKSFCNFHIHSNETIWEIKVLLFIEQKKQRVRSHYRFLSMLYIIWVKLL